MCFKLSTDPLLRPKSTHDQETTHLSDLTSETPHTHSLTHCFSSHSSFSIWDMPRLVSTSKRLHSVLYDLSWASHSTSFLSYRYQLKYYLLKGSWPDRHTHIHMQAEARMPTHTHTHTHTHTFSLSFTSKTCRRYLFHGTTTNKPTPSLPRKSEMLLEGRRHNKIAIEANLKRKKRKKTQP